MAARVSRWSTVSQNKINTLTISKYLADQNVDVRLATENVLAEFLREVKYIATVQEKQAESDRHRRESRALRRKGSKTTMESTATDGDSAIIEDEDDADTPTEGASIIQAEGAEHEWEGEGLGAWIPGQGVFVDHAAIMDIIIQHLSYPGESPITCYFLAKIR